MKCFLRSEKCLFLNFDGNKNEQRLFPKEDPDPLLPNVAMIRIRIHVKMRWIRNAGSLIDE